jgi:hypothetical protein
MLRVAALSAMLVLVAAPQVASAGTPPPGLSKNGRILWQFEALLHDTFSNRPVCTKGRLALSFRSGTCSPLAVYSPYFYVFANARGSAFHLSSPQKVGSFGNYPVVVFIRGRPVACNARETKFLILEAKARFTLGCL